MSPGQNTKKLGRWGEWQASLFLERKGFRVVERNFYTPNGEIDIVAEKGGDYYFVEVKTRAAGDLAYDTAVTAIKKYRLAKTAKQYCYRRNLTSTSLILASLMVVINHAHKTVDFRLAVLY